MNNQLSNILFIKNTVKILMLLCCVGSMLLCASCTKKSECGEIDGFHVTGVFRYFKEPVSVGTYAHEIFESRALLIVGEGEDADTIGFSERSVPISYRKPGLVQNVFVTFNYGTSGAIFGDRHFFKLLCIEKLD